MDKFLNKKHFSQCVAVVKAMEKLKFKWNVTKILLLQGNRLMLKYLLIILKVKKL